MSILRCFHESYYKGVISDAELRFSQYQTGRFPESYTHKRRPVELVFFYVFNDINQTTAFEKQVTGGRRKKRSPYK
ncbi:GIY-YIG nuclease family protein [Chryseobacterium sp.]|uniref:GIY-YIG nuclease family protein n=2 Tax=unclassified Chryseobacterium TaxID=2593645 RepID=UPI00260368D9|nr:GIY-YIG nuclease family protein [Chryseobacterium sp.]